MVALNVDTDGFRRTGELVDLAGTLLGTDFDDPTPVPACASDPASEAIMRNLNARHEWLLGHVRAGLGTGVQRRRRHERHRDRLRNRRHGRRRQLRPVRRRIHRGCRPGRNDECPDVGHGGAGQHADV